MSAERLSRLQGAILRTILNSPYQQVQQHDLIRLFHPPDWIKGQPPEVQFLAFWHWEDARKVVISGSLKNMKRKGLINIESRRVDHEVPHYSPYGSRKSMALMKMNFITLTEKGKSLGLRLVKDKEFQKNKKEV